MQPIAMITQKALARTMIARCIDHSFNPCEGADILLYEENDYCWAPTVDLRILWYVAAGQETCTPYLFDRTKDRIKQLEEREYFSFGILWHEDLPQ